MHLASDQTIKVTLVHSTHSPLPPDSQVSPLSGSQKLQPVNLAQQPPEKKANTRLLYSCFQRLAYVGQIGSALTALVLAIELASSLTVVMIILGIFWIGCKHFGLEEEGNRE